jgi:cell division protein FtsW
MQALIAWGSGGMEGLGLGHGRQKMLYLPYAHTDFIFPMIGEELGLRVSLVVVFLFIVIIVCGMMIALHAKDRFGMLLGCGIVTLLALQAAVNIGVTTSLLPNKGLPLPFISYGGSNLAACLFGVGILLSIYRQAKLEPGNTKRITMQARMTPRI